MTNNNNDSIDMTTLSDTLPVHKLDLVDRYDSLAQELEDNIMDHAGTFTKYLHGLLPLPLTKEQAMAVCAEAIKQDAVDSIALLPPGHQLTWEVLLIKSVAMKAAVQRHFKLSDDIGRFLDDPAKKSEEVSGRIGFFFFEQQIPKLVRPLLNDALDVLVSLQESQPGRKLLNTAVALGRLDITQKLLHKATAANRTGWSIHIEYAIKFGHVAVWRYLAQNVDKQFIDINELVASGNLEAVKTVHARFPDILDQLELDVFGEYIEHGGTDLALWLIQVLPHNHMFFKYVQNQAAALGHFDLLQHCIDNGIGEPLSDKAIRWAVAFDRFDSVVWLHEHGYRGSGDELDASVSDKSISVVEWLHEHGYRFSTRAIDNACSGGQVAVVKLLVANRIGGCTQSALTHCMWNGHVEIFRLLWDAYPDVRPSADNILYAAEKGQLWIIEFYLEQTHADAATVQMFVDKMEQSKHFGAAECVRRRFL